MLEDAINAHFDVGCYATFESQDGLRGGILSIPENKIKSIDKTTFLYETNDKSVTIYTNGIKQKVINVPNYAIRCLILCDIICKADIAGYSGLLIRPIKNGTLLEYTYDDIISTKNSVDMINIDISKREKILERKINQTFKDMVMLGEVAVSDDIVEGFNTIREHYLEEFGNDE